MRIADKKLSSEVGFRGIMRRSSSSLLVGIAQMVDINVIRNGSILRTAVIFFYLSNEGVSVLENAAHLGLPVPEKLKDVLEQLHDRRLENVKSTTSKKTQIVSSFFARGRDPAGILFLLIYPNDAQSKRSLLLYSKLTCVSPASHCQPPVWRKCPPKKNGISRPGS